jgi:parallel beta-helix repeat protein
MFIDFRPRGLASIVLLFVLSGAGGAAQAKTLYVTTTGVDGLTCGTVQAPCRSISQTIANATAGDILLVSPGRYGDVNQDGDFNDPGDEAATADIDGYLTMITVNKRLTLLSSAGAGATVLDGGKRVAAVVKITASRVIFGALGHGFTMRNGQAGDDRDFGSGLKVDYDTSNVTISGNIARDSTSMGFWLMGRGHTITHNTAKHNTLGFEACGFQITGGGHAVTYNVSTENGGEEGHGFCVGGQDILFFRNKTADNVESGIQIEGSRVLVVANEAKNSRYGFQVGGKDITLRHNVADDNYNGGFVISGTGHTLIANIARNPNDAGFYVSGRGHTFTRNISTGNGYEGGFVIDGNNLQFLHNTVTANKGAGFSVNGANVLIRRNSIKGNRAEGIFTDSTGVTITQNDFQGNGHYDGGTDTRKNCGVRNVSGGTVQAKNNFWGASTGPGPDPADKICNEPGSTTLFRPFASSPFNAP